MPSRAEISVAGVVQGVGYRPFIFRLATRHGLNGIVRNMGDAGVQIIVEGGKRAIQDFVSKIKTEHPPLARVEELHVKWKRATGRFQTFKVASSSKNGLGVSSILPPDLALCSDCLHELFSPGDRRHLYPFITCVNCGPRFTIVEELPYDRSRTSMREFPLCPKCSGEYNDPADRRYRAEPTCCPVCGPKMELRGSDGEIKTKDPFREAAALLDEGKLIAVKGIGGIHVAASTILDETLARLRQNFNRPQQPFAVMSKDLPTIGSFAKLNKFEEKLLVSYRRPIVVLRHSDGYNLSGLVAPGLDSIGVMLPYSGIHHLLLSHGKAPAYVMTSANISGLPMMTENSEALEKLKGKVDYFLLHNRRIVNRCDDSVVKVIGDKTTFLRRSRGWVPEPIKLNFKSEVKVLALGAELNGTTSLLVGDRCFPSQYIGDTSKVEALESLRVSTKSMMKLLGLKKIDLIAHDLHPGYATTRLASELAESWGVKRLAVQHHHAHLCSLMAEHGVDQIIGISADGVGYGSDGKSWGGEVMVANFGSFERLGGLMEQRIPGGDLAAIFPARMVAGTLWEVLEPGELRKVLLEFCATGFRHGRREIDVVLQQLGQDLNVPRTTSCGRMLDAISCLLGICQERTYEGEPAIKLEAVANTGDTNVIKLKPSFREVNGRMVVDTSKLLLDVLNAVRRGLSRRHIAAAAQIALAQGLGEIAVRAAKEEGFKIVGVSGGVFCNRAITRAVRKVVEEERLSFIQHELLPLGDGGISVGQAVSASVGKLLC